MSEMVVVVVNEVFKVKILVKSNEIKYQIGYVRN